VTDTSQPATPAGTIPPLGAGEVALLIPGVRHVTESSRELVSDLSIVNGVLGATVGDLAMYYSSAATSKSAPSSALAPTQSLNLADVVTGYFGETGQVGTIQLRSKSLSSLSVAANVFDRANEEGTYGTAIPLFRTDRAAGQGQKLVLAGLKQAAPSETKLYLQETSGTGAASLTVDFYGEDGTKIGTASPPAIPAFGLSVLDSPIAAGTASVVVTPSSGRLVAWATAVDAGSGDLWAVTDWERQFQASGSGRSIVPVAGALPGINDSYFRTDLSVMNTSGAPGSVNLVYHASTGASAAGTLDLAPNQSAALEDVVTTFFKVAAPSIGWISIEPVSGSFAVTSRTYTKPGAGSATFGTGVAAVPASIGLDGGSSRLFGGLEDSTSETVFSRRGGTFRTNAGLVEVAGEAATVRVSVYFSTPTQLSSGGAVAAKDFELPAHGFVALNGIVRQIVGDSRDSSYPDLRDVSVKVEVLGGAGTVIPFVTMTDNGTNDTLLRVE
jgi:hypothetical protein